MKKLTVLILAALTVSACNTQKSAKCPDMMCTQEFKFITVQLISGGGKSIDFKRYEVKTKAGKNVRSNPYPNAIGNSNTLVIADDSSLKKLSPQGDDLILTIFKNNGTSFDTPYKVSGGVCNCHVSKLAGPDEIDMDGK